MCQFPDIKDLLNEIYQGDADIEYGELWNFLPSDAQMLYTIPDYDDVHSVRTIVPLSTAFTAKLLGDVFNALVGKAFGWPSCYVQAYFSTVRLIGNTRNHDVPGITVEFKEGAGDRHHRGWTFNLILNDEWKETWLAVKPELFPTPDNVTNNHPMAIYSASELEPVVHPLIPKELRAYVVSELAKSYGWKRSVYAGNQVCLIG